MKNVKKIISVVMLFAMLMTMVSGCGSRPAEGESAAVQNSEENKSREPDENIAMGRYVEEVTDLSDRISGYNNKMVKLTDGRIVISDEYRDFIVSSDNGATWETYQLDWLTELQENGPYIYDLKMGTDGTICAVLDKDTEEDSDADPETGSEIPELFTRLLIVRPDGTQQYVETPVETKYIRDVWISETGRIFITIYGEPIYEVKEDGSCEKFLSVGRIPELIQFQGNFMILDGWDYDGYLIYDMEKKTYTEDEVLADFITENYKDRDTNGGSYFDLFFCLREEGVLYLAGAKGLYRHVIGGNAMEQVIDGSLSSFNNPTNKVQGMIPLDNNEFLVLFTDGKLVRFVYDPNVPTVPNERLKVYSLSEDDLIRQAVFLYQTANPEVYVEYEIGMDENSSITKEDALKSLNTEIMAGDGPDVLILDNMPIDSYLDKGLLMDLKPMLESLEGDDAIFTNIANAFEKDGKICMMPCQINLPVMLGREEFISQMNDLKSLADTVEKMREEMPGKDLLGIASERGIMKMYAMTSAPAWKTENGEINTRNISDFLEQTRRIYDAQMNSLDSKIKEYWDILNEEYMAELGILREDSKYFRIGLDEIGYIGKDRQTVSGTVYDFYAYSMSTSVSRIQNFEDSRLIPMPGQCRNTFWAQTIAGVSAASENAKRGEEFLRVLLGKENQLSTFFGLPVNKAAFEEKLIPDDTVKEDGQFSSIARSDGSGTYVSMNLYWPNEEQISSLRGWMENASIPYVEDVRLENAVYEQGAEYLCGFQSLEETVSAIEEKVALYMAE